MPALETLTVRELFVRASSTAPSPGGGAVAAVGGMLGISLILKALRISIRNTDGAESYAGEDIELVALAARLSEDADADERAFGAYIAAARLPKQSEAERAVRSEALRSAALAATEAAIEMLRHAFDAYAISRRIEPAIKSSIRADLVGGRELLKVVRTVALENAEANLSALRDAPQREALEQLIARFGDPAAFS